MQQLNSFIATAVAILLAVLLNKQIQKTANSKGNSIVIMDPPAESVSSPATDKTSATPSSFTAPSRAKIVLWGDSLTQTSFDGWGSQLANRYQRRADILNRGMSGYNTRWFLELPLAEEYASETTTAGSSSNNVALCVIWFGANDASLPNLNPHHYVSLEDYQANLQTLVGNAQRLFGSTTRILLVTPPPVHHGQRLEYQKTRYGDKATGVLERTLENSGKYAEACQKAASDLKLPCLNLWKAFQDEGDDWGRFLSDGLHFSPAGHDFVFQQLQQMIQSEFPELHITPCPHTQQSCNSGSQSGIDGVMGRLPAFGPYHDQIDAQNPKESMSAAFPSKAGSAEAGSPSSKKAKIDAPE